MRSSATARAPRTAATRPASRAPRWFDREAPHGRLTEIDAVAALESFRRDTGTLKDISFPTIAGSGPTGDGITASRAPPTASLRRRMFLLDSGAQ